MMRYLPLSDSDRTDMLGVTGAGSVEDFYDSDGGVIDGLPDHQSEQAVETHMSELASRNRHAGQGPFFLGCGIYRHHVPASVDHIIQRSEFLTSYTPYQAEIAQGTLQTLFEFQSQVAALTGMDIANASLYDGAAACAEAALMACRITGRSRIVLSDALHPHYAQTVRTLCSMRDLVVDQGGDPTTDTACLIVQNPGWTGATCDLSPDARKAHECGALLVAVVTEVVSLGVLSSPGDMGADIVALEGQSLGNGMNFGGPLLGIIAARKAHMRQIPGRLAGIGRDADGRRAYTLTLSAREQHIRRERATSNVCTNSGLCALAFSVHASLLGGEGLWQLARINHERAVRLADSLSRIDGVRVVTDHFFNEFSYWVPLPAVQVLDRLGREYGVLGGVAASRLALEDTHTIITAATECCSDEDIAAYAEALGGVLAQ